MGVGNGLWAGLTNDIPANSHALYIHVCHRPTDQKLRSHALNAISHA